MSLSGGYDFSHLYHSSITAFSPGSTFLATAHGRRVIVRSTTALTIVRTFQCLGGVASSSKQFDSVCIDQILWSADSLYILAFSTKAATAWIFGLADEGNGEGGEVSRIGGEGPDGLARVEWGRGDREILAWSEYGLKLTIWNLVAWNGSVIQHPRSTTCHAYSSDGRYFAMAEQHSSKDYIGVYDAGNGYALIRHFALHTSDAQALLWSPCGRFIAVYDSILQYALYIYSPLGVLLHTCAPSSPNFSSSSTADDPGLGIRCAAWAPGGRWIALGGWDGKVKVVESESGRCIANLAWNGRIVEKDTVTWREPNDWLRETRGRGIVQFNRTIGTTPVPCVRGDITKSPPRCGISQMAFDDEGTLLLVRLETQPHVVHIHTFLPTPTSSSPEVASLACLILTETVRSARWCPGRKKVAITTKTGGVYLWDGDGGWVEDGQKATDVRGGTMEGVGIPTQTAFFTSDAIWAPDGNSLTLMDRVNSQFCVLYDDAPAEESGFGGESCTRRWDRLEGLTHVSEGDEEEEETGGSHLSSLAEAETLWRAAQPLSMGLVQ